VVLKHLGPSGVGEMIECCCRHASRFSEGIKGGGYSVLNDVVLNEELLSFGEPEITEAVIKQVQEEDVEMSITSILRAANEVTGTV
jgi:glutamate/tyrosine decarboxylase-like PLP-dependent enzyme